MMQITQLGWVNCDRFYNTPGPKVALAVRATGASVQLIGRRFRGILDDAIPKGKGWFSCKGLPKGEPVTILAMRRAGEQVWVATRQVEVNGQAETDFDFHPVTVKELRAEIARLE